MEIFIYMALCFNMWSRPDLVEKENVVSQDFMKHFGLCYSFCLLF